MYWRESCQTSPNPALLSAATIFLPETTGDLGMGIFNREKNAEEAGLIKIYEYKIGENVNILEEKF